MSIQPMEPCGFDGDSPAVTPDSDLIGDYLVNLGETTITAAVAVRVEGVSLVYVAYSGAIAVGWHRPPEEHGVRPPLLWPV